MSQKIYSTILLDENDNYLCEEKLPHRPLWDKELLKSMVSEEIISKQAAELLPKSIRETARAVTNEIQPTIGITIKEISALSDILIVIRSTKICKGTGKKFRFTNFKRILREFNLEIWKRT